MLLRVQQLMDATLMVSAVIREARPMPQRGKFRLARLHARLEPEFKTINEQRNALIRAFDTPDPEHEGQWIVPAEQLAAFNAQWAEIAETVIDVDVAPVPLADIDNGPEANGAIEAHELVVLGDLIAD